MDEPKPNDVTDDQMVQQMAEIHLFANNHIQDIQHIKRKIQKDIEKNEVLLDLHCDEISRDIGANELSKNASDSFEISGTTNVTNRTTGSNSDYSKMKLMPSNGTNIELKADKSWNNLPLSPKSSPNSEPIALNSDQSRARRPSNLPRFNINSSGRMFQRTPIDPQKKSKLLAQLKSIEAANTNH